MNYGASRVGHVKPPFTRLHQLRAQPRLLFPENTRSSPAPYWYVYTVCFHKPWQAQDTETANAPPNRRGARLHGEAQPSGYHSAFHFHRTYLPLVKHTLLLVRSCGSFGLLICVPSACLGLRVGLGFVHILWIELRCCMRQAMTSVATGQIRRPSSEGSDVSEPLPGSLKNLQIEVCLHYLLHTGPNLVSARRISEATMRFTHTRRV